MRPGFQRRVGQCVTAMAAALFVAAVGFASVGDSLAHYDQKKIRAQKNALAPAKGQVQQRRNAMPPGMVPNRGGFPGQALGPNRAPNARIAPNAGNQSVKGPKPSGQTAVNPRANTFGKGGPPIGAAQGQNQNAKSANTGPGTTNRFGNNQPGGNNRFGTNQFGNRQGGFGNNRQGAFGNNRFGGRGFTNRDPRLRAVNGATPQLRQVQRFSHRGEMFAVRARIPIYPLPGERNFTGVPPPSETRFVRTEMICQFGPDVTPEAIAETARRHNLTIIATQRSALTGATLVQFAHRGNRGTADVVRAMEAERIVSQPNYIYLLGQTAAGPGRAQTRGGAIR